MELDSRIKKLATGLSARDAAEAHVRATGADDTLTDAEKAQASEFAATVEAMFLMAAVDGVIADEEVDKLAEGICFLIGEGSVNSATVLNWLGELHQRLEHDGWSQRLNEAAANLSTAEARARAFRLAAGIAMVDDQVAHAEAAAIDAFAAALQIDDDDVSRILREVQRELFGED